MNSQTCSQADKQLNTILTIGRQKKLCCIPLRQPSNFVNLLFNLKALQVVKLRLMALEGAVHIILPSRLWPILILNNDRGKKQRSSALNHAWSQDSKSIWHKVRCIPLAAAEKWQHDPPCPQWLAAPQCGWIQQWIWCQLSIKKYS